MTGRSFGGPPRSRHLGGSGWQKLPDTPVAKTAKGNEIEIAPEIRSAIEAVVPIIRTYFDQPDDMLTRAIAEEIVLAVAPVFRE